jgi:hypothetical protein
VEEPISIVRLRLRSSSPALIIACLALFAALGGSAYAAAQTRASGKVHFTNAALKNGWTNSGARFPPAGYAMDSSGIVHLRGSIHGGMGSAFVLPRGLRPSHVLDIPDVIAGADAYVFITKDGKVNPEGEATAASALTSLDGISFAAGQ